MKLLPMLGADPHVPRTMALVGRYAVGVTWQDDHGSIYAFDALRALCPCGICPPVARAWPAEITRSAEAVVVRWDDGHVSRLPHPVLRAACPCATCASGPARR